MSGFFCNPTDHSLLAYGKADFGSLDQTQQPLAGTQCEEVCDMRLPGLLTQGGVGRQIRLQGVSVELSGAAGPAGSASACLSSAAPDKGPCPGAASRPRPVWQGSYALERAPSARLEHTLGLPCARLLPASLYSPPAGLCVTGKERVPPGPWGSRVLLVLTSGPTS